MEVNKDEADRCIEMAETFITERNREKAEKFLHKAERLYPTQRAKDLLAKISLMAPMMDSEKVRQRKPAPKPEKPAAPEYTPEQSEAVKRIKTCKDYYEILGISKDATDSEIKKSYKKLALQLHPDKNKCPGSVEAFKAIGNAVAVLTDAEKRKQYDLHGPESPSNPRMSGRHQGGYHTHGYTRGFEAEATADELFNMFFGTGFSGGNVYVRRDGRFQRTAQREQTHAHHGREQQQSSMSMILQMLPILLAILLSMFSSMFISDPAYSLQQSPKYPVARVTQNLRVDYWVKEKFHSEYQGSLGRLEATIEEEYVTNLKHACYRERNYRESMIWKARNFGDRELLTTAQNMKLPSCERFQNLRAHGSF